MGILKNTLTMFLYMNVPFCWLQRSISLELGKLDKLHKLWVPPIEYKNFSAF